MPKSQIIWKWFEIRKNHLKISNDFKIKNQLKISNDFWIKNRQNFSNYFEIKNQQKCWKIMIIKSIIFNLKPVSKYQNNSILFKFYFIRCNKKWNLRVILSPFFTNDFEIKNRQNFSNDFGIKNHQKCWKSWWF